MKNLKINIILILLIAIVSFGFAQPTTLKEKKIIEVRDELFKNTSIVFEGTVIKKLNYLNKRKEPISSYILKVHKTFLGNLSNGTIEIVGPGTGDFYDSVENRSFSIEYSHGGIGFTEGLSGIFFCDIVSGNDFMKYYPTENSIILNYKNVIGYYDNIKYHYLPYLASISFQSKNGEYNQLEFKNSNDLYNYLIQYKGSSFMNLDQKQFVKQMRPSTQIDTSTINRTEPFSPPDDFDKK